jgi:hypothetical protein
VSKKKGKNLIFFSKKLLYVIYDLYSAFAIRDGYGEFDAIPYRLRSVCVCVCERERETDRQTERDNNVECSPWPRFKRK